MADLQKKAEELDSISNVSARKYVDVYFELAEIYLKTGLKEKAMESLQKGLRLESWNYKYQLLLAKLEIDAQLYLKAYERLHFINRFCEDREYCRMADKLLKKPEFKIYMKQDPPPSLSGYNYT